MQYLHPVHAMVGTSMNAATAFSYTAASASVKGLNSLVESVLTFSRTYAKCPMPVRMLITPGCEAA